MLQADSTGYVPEFNICMCINICQFKHNYLKALSYFLHDFEDRKIIKKLEVIPRFADKRIELWPETHTS